MSELLQSGQFPGASGQHPDADQLSAFVEQALPAHERRQVLAHLAVCPGCRETVVLSLPHLEAPAREPARRQWFRAWTILVPSAAALSAAIFFAISVHHTNNARKIIIQPAQIAASQPPVPVQPSAESPALRTVVPEDKKSPPAHRLADAPAAKTAERQQLDALSAAPQARPFPEAIIAPESARPADAQPESEAHPAVQAPAAPVAAPAPPPVTNAPLSSATQTVAANSQAPILNTTSTALGMLAAPSTPHPVVFTHPLPGGQVPLSVAANGSAILAIDAHNAVFFSRDSGKHWTAVTAPWQGRAVRVALVADRTVHGTAFAPVAGGMLPLADAAKTSPASGASLTGIVTDLTGATIPNANVTVRDSATNTERTLTTDSNGSYRADNLPPGSYTLDAQAPGFKSQHLTDIAVEASRQSVQNLTLEVGSVSQSVEVAAESEAAPRTRAARSKALKAPAAVPSQPVFSLSTDTGEQWISTDGLTWQRR